MIFSPKGGPSYEQNIQSSMERDARLLCGRFGAGEDPSGQEEYAPGGKHPFPRRDGTAPCHRRLGRGLQFHLCGRDGSGSGAHW